MILIIAQIIFLATAIGLSVLILLQQSKGAGIGASFGAGASGTVFGARGAGSFLYKLTRILAVIFFISALMMGYVQNKQANSGNILQNNQFETQNSAAGIDVPLGDSDNSAPASDAGIPLESNQ
ncbi:preprotein translocase subunit SecG [Suttonella indologenes]|uniref:Protein-export membrane protein SecG n=1 Tax=Suttonella indologenes TaxID=13276 RepID=A0A380MWQ4_9GAMM|nr:preprotein translocase subunit SecG [Suttonella indologenes]SUO96333.1 Preprotein translocase band 1 subunit [Suttonella indologenes]